MNLSRVFVLSSLAVLLAACGSSSTPVASTHSAMPTSPATSITADSDGVTDDDSAVDCTELGNDGLPLVTQQASMTIDEQNFQIATVACSNDTGEASAEVVESFIRDGAMWASNGLASGPDVAFRTTGECIGDGSQIQCPANAVSEDGSDISGMIVITADNGQPVWNFETIN